MNFYRIINQFLAGIMIMIYHLFVGKFMDRTSMAFIISMYIFVLTMIRITGLPVNEKGHIEESDETKINSPFNF